MRHTLNFGLTMAGLVCAVSTYAQIPFQLGDIWRGEYVCGQGLTPASLRIRKVSASDSTISVQGIFDFGGGGLPRGTYLVAGDYEIKNNKLKLVPTGWLSRPGQYIAVGLTGSLTNGSATLAGSIDHASCRDFVFHKEGRQLQPGSPSPSEQVTVAPAPEQTSSQRLRQARESYCMECHDINKKLLGPALKDIAAKYAGKPAAVSELTKRVLHGSVGNWGNLPQPPMTDPRFIGRPLTEQEVRLLVEWILSLRNL